MRHRATCIWCEPFATVTDAVLGADSVSVDWSDGWGDGTLKATTSDGSRYEGRFSYKGQPHLGVVQFTRFHSAEGEQLFLGSWRSETDGTHGEWGFRLSSPDAPPTL